jgi:hypothetical protein
MHRCSSAAFAAAIAAALLAVGAQADGLFGTITPKS